MYDRFRLGVLNVKLLSVLSSVKNFALVGFSVFWCILNGNNREQAGIFFKMKFNFLLSGYEASSIAGALMTF